MPTKLPSPLDRTQAVSEPSPSRVVPKPVPGSQTTDPRGYQLSQLRRRHSPKESTLDDGSTSLFFKLSPSDPDFPFDLDALECDLSVPVAYPADPPTLRVRNSGMPRGFAINVERGWDRLVKESKGATLLTLTNLLDKNLETILAEERADTVKLMAFKDTRHLEQREQTRKTPAAKSPPVEPPKKEAPVFAREPSFTWDEINEAKGRRARETRQLEARMGRLPSYHRSPDGIVYTLPLEPRNRAQLPPGLQGVKTVYLIVPLLYPLQQLRIQLNEADAADAEPVEELFALKAAEQRQMNLTSHMNYLAVNLLVLTKMASFQAKLEKEEKEDRGRQEEADREEGKEAAETEDFVKSHVKVIPRPPEWEYDDRGSDSESDWSQDADYDNYDSGAEQDGGAALDSKTSSKTVEKGTALLFPSIELYGIEILELSVLNLSVKCSRCKTTHDIKNLKHGVEKTDSCSKCANPFAASYTQEPIHQHSNRAGLIDMGGCTIADLLQSTFTPTCSECSKPAAGINAVRGDSKSNICRECHTRFNFNLPEVKFLRVSPGSLVPSAITGRKKREKLGLQAGEELPARGTCKHYRKSHRWFRFSCCGRVHPCDKCHDETEGHINEWASRMICGFCSREQRYAVEACGFCGRSVIGKRGRGFWEGGQGTRDRRLMNRKDGKKYKRVGGGEAAASKS